MECANDKHDVYFQLGYAMSGLENRTKKSRQRCLDDLEQWRNDHLSKLGCDGYAPSATEADPEHRNGGCCEVHSPGSAEWKASRTGASQEAKR